MKKNLFLLLTLILSLPITAQENGRNVIDLQGRWQFTLDADSTVKPTDTFNDWVMLPGTTDTNKKGNPATKKDETTHLTRLFTYFGKAWYRHDVNIPATWKKKVIHLFLERTKPTVVYVDGNRVGSCDDISTPHIYDLTSFLIPGRHIITVMVDNGYSVPKQLLNNSHAYTEDTQTNWNGIIGKIYLEASNLLHIKEMKIHPDAITKTVEVSLRISGKISKNDRIKISAIPINWNGIIHSIDIFPSKQTGSLIQAKLDLGNEAQLWSEFHPNLYTLEAIIADVDTLSESFGLIDFKARDNHFYVNGHLTFLRGKHDACVFPFTAHTSMDVEGWRKYFQTAKSYGINHYRFHSWCPPEACFEAADMEGVYLQPELPFWGDFNKKDKYLMAFLHKEGVNILNTYCHHPSFVMMALGNELWGDIPTMKQFTDDFRTIDSTVLYTFGSNYYLGYQGYKPGMDYFTTCRIGGEADKQFNTHTRGSFSFADTYDGGYINHTYPNTEMNFEGAIKNCPVPVISHETCQFQTYPDYNEIKKYTGVLYPYNLEVFRNRLDKAGMLSQAADFHKASGLWSVQLYKADMEMDLRTRNMAGFQLLDLQDYPGQGSAYIGILDAFMETKGITTPKEFGQFCSPIVPLLITKKFCFTNDEALSGSIEITNFSEETLTDKTLTWQLVDTSDSIIGKGTFNIPNDSVGVFTVGNLSIHLNDIGCAKRLNLNIVIDGTSYGNTYPVWVYPATDKIAQLGKGIIITDTMTEAIKSKLARGAKVLFMPKPSKLTVGGLFQTDYWNYRMFKTISENNKKPVSPGTLGILTDPTHPIFTDYPTECHTNWQWFPVIKASHPFILDNMPSDYRPVVQVIDNIERNHKLGLIFELAIGKGKMLICMSDLNATKQYPESRQLYESILEYMKSEKFAPAHNLSMDEFMRLMTSEVSDTNIGKLNNISFE